jgi:hypothetical protein
MALVIFAGRELYAYCPGRKLQIDRLQLPILPLLDPFTTMLLHICSESAIELTIQGMYD